MAQQNKQIVGTILTRFWAFTDRCEGMSIVDEFNEDPDVFAFLISIMAGGVGLNLVAANKVVIFDPNWSTCVFF